jgi:serine/threonine-protein kinase
MGEVYLAHDERLGRKVAIKLLSKRLIEDEERIRRFKHEARSASAISHPNVAHVYEIGESEGRFFTAMEFVNGVTLRERFARGPLKFGEVIDIATQVSLAISAAHAQGYSLRYQARKHQDSA